jgi:hypothetical protein
MDPLEWKPVSQDSGAVFPAGVCAILPIDPLKLSDHLIIPSFSPFLPIQFSDQKSLFFGIFTFLGGSSAEEGVLIPPSPKFVSNIHKKKLG